jgi:integrase
VEEIIAVTRVAGESAEGVRLCGIIVVLWPAGPRISEALALNETDLDPDRGSPIVRHGKRDSAARWGWTGGRGHTSPHGSKSASRCRSGGCSASFAARPAGGHALRPGSARPAAQCSPQRRVRRRFAPHQLRDAHAVEMSREGISLIVIQRQLGHADLAITSRYLRGIDNAEIIAAVHDRPAPMIPADSRQTSRC